MRKRLLDFFIIVLFFSFKASGQDAGHHGIASVVAAIDSFHKRKPFEKLYLHLDKPCYAIGDTMRFKAYSLDEALLSSAKSGIMYVELINDSSRVCKRQTIMIKNGIAWGDIVIKRTWYAGNYTMRAYTNWMRNFGEEHFFTKLISIIPNSNLQWLVNDRLAIDKDKNVNVSLHFSDVDHNNIGFRDMQLQVLNGADILLTNAARTDAHGNTDINFKLPANLADQQLAILADDISKGGSKNKITIPIQLNRPENIDLQFMPEGGSLIAGITTHMGFKAIGENGKGIDISGKIYNGKQQEVTTFKSTHLGMGNFELTPQPGESYTAKIHLPDGTTKSYALPLVNLAGIALSVEPENDSLKITLTATATASATTTYYLIGQARGKVRYEETILFSNKMVIQEIAKSIFPTGIVKWVLLDDGNQPISQRMVFVDHNDRLNIHINSNKENYHPRDSVALQLAVTDLNNNPVQGSFSLAVTDDNQVKAPGADAENIASYMLLNPDLKGNIEEPGYYFNKEHADSEAALDNLLLTQGWAGYDWKPVFEPPVLPKYETETQFEVKGRVSNIFNKPIANTEVMLTSVKPPLYMDTTTNKDGRFVFSGFPLLDVISFHLQPKRSFNVGIDVDEFIPPDFTPLKTNNMPWYVNSDSTLMNYVNNKKVEQDGLLETDKSKLLKTVNIHGRKIVPSPPPILKLNEEDIRNARTGEKPLNLLILLEKYIKGGLPISLIVDGAGVSSLWPPYWVTPEYWLDQYHTEDIKSFTVTKQPGGLMPVLVINITSNAGKGGPPSGIWGYAYRPMPISWPHKFYSPRYTVKDTIAIKDRRSTIYWAPDITTDASGKASVSFYTADTPGNYTIIMQGANIGGDIGYKMQKIKVGSTIGANLTNDN